MSLRNKFTVEARVGKRDNGKTVISKLIFLPLKTTDRITNLKNHKTVIEYTAVQRYGIERLFPVDVCLAWCANMELDTWRCSKKGVPRGVWQGSKALVHGERRDKFQEAELRKDGDVTAYSGKKDSGHGGPIVVKRGNPIIQGTKWSRVSLREIGQAGISAKNTLRFTKR